MHRAREPPTGCQIGQNCFELDEGLKCYQDNYRHRSGPVPGERERRQTGTQRQTLRCIMLFQRNVRACVSGTPCFRPKISTTLYYIVEKSLSIDRMTEGE